MADTARYSAPDAARTLTVHAADGVRLACELVGSGPPVLVCCGGPNTTYEYLRRDLAPLTASYTLVFHHYRGSGTSQIADPNSYTFEQLADDLIAICDALELNHPSVLAHSLGGFAALLFALRHPDRCQRLVLLSCSPTGRTSRLVVPTLKALGPRRAARTLSSALRYLVTWSWRRPSPERSQAHHAIMATLQEGRPQFRAAVAEREVFADNDNAPHLLRAAAGLDLTDRLHHIQAPVLVVHGTKDAPFHAAAPLLTRRLPSAVDFPLPGAGHHPLVEDPATVLDRITQFLTDKQSTCHE